MKILVLKLEKLNQCYKRAMNDFFGINVGKMHNANISSNKRQKGLYNYLKENLRFDLEYLHELYKNKYVTHFYSAKEITGFIEKYKSIDGC